MKISLRTLAASVLLCLLAGCGGGGGGGGGGTPTTSSPAGPGSAPGGSTTGSTPDNSWLQLTPSAITHTQYAGESSNFTIIAKSSNTILQNFQLGIFDSTGIITTDVGLNPLGSYEYQAVVRTAATLAPGSHTGKLEIRLCEDNPLTCAKPATGSPWFVPISVNVLPLNNLKPLALPVVSRPWSTLGGNAAHSGLVPETFNPANFNRRWSWQPADTYIGGNEGYDADLEPAIDSGLVFQLTTSSSTETRKDWTLRAISEETGTEVWSVSMGEADSAHPPAASNGKIYLTTYMYSEGQHMYFWTFDQKTGALLGKRDISSPSWTSAVMKIGAPTPSGAGVYGALSPQGGFYKADAATGANVWMNVVDGLRGAWTPAVDGNYAYVSANGESVGVYHIADGKEAFVIGDHKVVSTKSPTTPVLGDRGQLLVSEVRAGQYRVLRAFDLSAKANAWQQSEVTSHPVTGQGVVYFMQGRDVVAVDAVTGAKRWSTTLVSTFADPSLVLTNNLLFVSDSRGNNEHTVALDLASHKEVWNLRAAGKLTLSDRGVLYLSRRNGQGMIAVNLR